VNVQVLADPAARLICTSPALPGARHDMGTACEHGIIDALREAGVQVIVDHGYRGSGFETPQRRRPADPETGERANAQLKAWRDPPKDPLLSAPSDRPGQGDLGAFQARKQTR
jgi:hypothetical protein